MLFPHYYDRRDAGDYLPDAGTSQEQHRRVLPEGIGVGRYTPAGTEFIKLQLAAILSAVVLGLAIGEPLGLLHILGIAGIEYCSFVVAVRVLEAGHRRFFAIGSTPQPAGDAVGGRQRERWWVAQARYAYVGLACSAIALHVHPLLSQFGALFAAVVVLSDVTMLVHRLRSQRQCSIDTLTGNV
jgi:hypothetical protein